MKHFFGLIIGLLFSFNLSAQYDIKFDIQNYDNDTLVIGYYMMNKQLVHDTLYREKDIFRLQGQDTLGPGTYILLTKPENQFLQFLVTDTEKNFTLKFDHADRSKISYDNAPDNQAFQDYVNFLSEKRPAANILRDTIGKLSQAGLPTEDFQKELSKIDVAVDEKQNELIAKNPDYLSSISIKANKDVVVPDFSDAEDPNFERFVYYRDHFFDNIDLSNPTMLRSPFLFGKIEYYLNKLTVTHPDSIVKSLDFIFERMGEDTETYRYYLSHYLNEYANTKIIGFDKVYVDLVDKYYSKGRAPWVEEDNLLKIIDRANKIRPTLLGKTGADLKLYQEDGTPVMMSEIDYEYLIMMFWAPECGHCTKSMPALVEFNEKWAPKGVKTLAICNKLQDKTKGCWEELEEKNMLGFINLADQYHDSRFKLKYNVTKTPKIFILDKNREILMKDIGTDQLDTMIEEIIKMKEAEEIEEKG